jgi:hypothetical protein
MPSIFLPIGALGLIPFIFFGLGALGNNPSSAQAMLVGLVDYAALMLTFAGGVHWGVALAPMPARPATRFGLGVVPLIVAWVALVSAQALTPVAALTILCLGYLVTAVVEHRAAKQWLLPRNYMALRWIISIVGLIMMVLVIVFRTLGQTIVF